MGNSTNTGFYDIILEHEMGHYGFEFLEVMMAYSDKDIDITRNIKTIEWLKSELLTDLANLFKALVNGLREDVHDSVSETLSNIILISYLLGRRLGLSYNAIEMKVESKIKLGLIENHDVEKYYGDLSELAKHMNASRLKRQ